MSSSGNKEFCAARGAVSALLDCLNAEHRAILALDHQALSEHASAKATLQLQAHQAHQTWRTSTTRNEAVSINEVGEYKALLGATQRALRRNDDLLRFASELADEVLAKRPLANRYDANGRHKPPERSSIQKRI